MPTSHNLSQPLTTSHNLLIRSRPPIATQARALVLFFGIFLRQVPTYLPTQMSVNNCIILMCVHLNIIVPNLIILVHLSIQLCTTQLIASLFHSHIIVSLSLSLSLFEADPMQKGSYESCRLCSEQKTTNKQVGEKRHNKKGKYFLIS